jgi:hypothetical protein
LPDATHDIVRKAVTELVREHQDLATVVRLMRKHVRPHGAAGWPNGRPTAARELPYLAFWLSGESVGEHAQTLRRTFFVGGGGLLHGDAIGIDWSGAFQVRGGILDPDETIVVKMRENGGDGAAAAALGFGQLRAPSSRVEIREKELVHRVIDRVGFQ